ncbi:hypothetical protein S245_043976 [Arachis hypogaea]
MCRSSKELKSQDIEESSSGHSKCILQSVKASLTKQPRSESMRYTVSDGPRKSMDRVDGSGVSPVPSYRSSKRITEPSSAKKQSKMIESFEEKKRKELSLSMFKTHNPATNLIQISFTTKAFHETHFRSLLLDDSLPPSSLRISSSWSSRRLHRARIHQRLPAVSTIKQLHREKQQRR